MKRHSIKKASTFKLQAQKSKFVTYLDQIENCKTAGRFPQMVDMIRQTSETVFNYCYSFREDSPFLKGLNYRSKQIGFSFQDNQLTYKQWLPNIAQAYLMGEFNNFNKESHKLSLIQDQGKDWYKIQIDLNGVHLQIQGSKFMLRILDHQGTQYHLIPPSCHLVCKGYGLVKNEQILPLKKKKARINQLLAYTIDLQKTSLDECLQLLQKQKLIFEVYNTIILKNLFKNNYGMLHKFTVQYNDLDKLRDIILRIKNECGCKAVIEWNLEPGQMTSFKNPIQSKFCKQVNSKVQFNFSQTQVIAYYLSKASYFYQNFGIDGIHFTNVGQFCKYKQGITVLKCLNILNSRIIQQGITLGSAKQHIPGISQSIYDGGLGFSFTYNYHQSLVLDKNCQQLLSTISQISNQSNCVAINFNNYDQDNWLNLFYAIFLSPKGIFTTGDFSQLKDQLKKILKLRSQDQFFINQIQYIKEDGQLIVVKRGNAYILFNFSEQEQQIFVQGIGQFEQIFSSSQQELQKKDNSVMMKRKGCMLFEDNSK